MNKVLQLLAKHLNITIDFELVNMNSSIEDIDYNYLDSTSHVIFKVQNYYIQVEREGNWYNFRYTDDVTNYEWTLFATWKQPTDKLELYLTTVDQLWKLN